MLAANPQNSVEFAFKLGCNAIRLAGIKEYSTPQLLKKD
jgi:hypothetical protein